MYAKQNIRHTSLSVVFSVVWKGEEKQTGVWEGAAEAFTEFSTDSCWYVH